MVGGVIISSDPRCSPHPTPPHTQLTWINTLRPRQNGRRFADDTFKCIFLNEDIKISIKISLKFVPKGQINNIPALVQIMAWHRPGDKPLSDAYIVYWRIYASLGLNELKTLQNLLMHQHKILLFGSDVIWKNWGFNQIVKNSKNKKCSNALRTLRNFCS